MNPAGVIYAVLASLIWGFVPVFWRSLDSIPPFDLIAQRLIWTSLFSAGLLLLVRRGRELARAFSDLNHALRVLIGACLIVSNWVIFVWAVVNDHVVDASLGYYLNPLMSVLLGMLVLREQLSLLQAVSVALAILGVGVLVWDYQGLPWISVGLGLSFGLYGLVHKLTDVNPIARLTIESAALVPLAIWFLMTQRPPESPFFGTHDATVTSLVIATGPVTIAPLVLFGSAARRLTLTSLGLFQYMGPTITFLLAVYGFGEPLTRGHWITFPLIWLALGVYSYESFGEPKSLTPSV